MELPGHREETRQIDASLATRLALGVVGSALGLLVVFAALDISLHDGSWAAFFAAWSNGLPGAVEPLAEVLAAVLGISLTVVAIVVQLAAQRYPAKIVDVFMFDSVNIGVFGFMAVSCIYVVLVPVFAGESIPSVWLSGAAIVLSVINFGILLPYFAHVFAFLEPTNLISEIKARAHESLAGVVDGSTREIKKAQRLISVSVDRIADNCMAAVGQSDRNLALHSIRTIEDFLTLYLSRKKSLPEQWSQVEWDFFGTLAQEFVDEIVGSGTWLEAKGFMEFERILRRSIADMSEVVSQLARSTRVIGEEALVHGEVEVVELVVRFFNTYVRHGLNHRNVRAVYNILYEYRRLALVVLRDDPDLARRIVEHLVYYGRTGNEMGLPFVAVTVAHDVRVICQAAEEHDDVDERRLLELFLKLDQPVEVKTTEVALIGVRKAQSILGAYYLSSGNVEFAQMIREDMLYESPQRLETIRDEILAVEERKFWEITDRGHNFDYVEDELRPYIEEFFEPLSREGASELDRNVEPVA